MCLPRIEQFGLHETKEVLHHGIIQAVAFTRTYFGNAVLLGLFLVSWHAGSAILDQNAI